MAYEFKKLKDVTTVEEVTNKANVLIEEDGIIKKVNKNEISGLKELSWNDLKDKPFGSKIGLVVCHPEETIEMYDGYNGFSEQIHIAKLFEAGKKYVVNFDGKTYECVSKNWEIDETTSCVIGNVALAFYAVNPVDTGEPFCFKMDYYSAESKLVYVYTPNGGSHTFSIYEEGEVVEQLDPKFIPSNVGTPLVLDADNPDGYNNYDYFINKEFVDYFFEYGVIPPVIIISTEGSGKLLWTPEFFIQDGRGGVRIDAYNRATEYNDRKSVWVVKDEESASNPYGN